MNATATSKSVEIQGICKRGRRLAKGTEKEGRCRCVGGISQCWKRARRLVERNWVTSFQGIMMRWKLTQIELKKFCFSDSIKYFEPLLSSLLGKPGRISLLSRTTPQLLSPEGKSVCRWFFRTRSWGSSMLYVLRRRNYYRSTVAMVYQQMGKGTTTTALLSTLSCREIINLDFRSKESRRNDESRRRSTRSTRFCLRLLCEFKKVSSSKHNTMLWYQLFVRVHISVLSRLTTPRRKRYVDMKSFEKKYLAGVLQFWLDARIVEVNSACSMARWRRYVIHNFALKYQLISLVI